MNKIKLVAIDIGGTLITDQNKIPDKNIETIKKIKQLGIKISLITARMYSSTKYISKVIDSDYGVYGNGSNVIDLSNNEIIYSEKLDKEDIDKLLQFARSEKLYIHLSEYFYETSDEMKYFALKHTILNRNYPDNLKSNIQVVNNLEDYVSNNSNLVKIIFVSENNMDDIVEKIKLQFPNLYITEYNKDSYEDALNQTISYIEIGKKNSTKADGLKQLISNLGLENDEVLVIGDGNNDIEMFDSYLFSGCLKNGSENAKEHAMYISNNTNNQAGVSEIIKHYIRR